MKIFRGGYGYTITVEDGDNSYKLKPRGVFSTGFCWGRGQPCASETALAILSHVLGYKSARQLHTHFKWDVVVSGLRENKWTLREDWIKEWARKKRKYLKKKNILNEWA